MNKIKVLKLRIKGYLRNLFLLFLCFKEILRGFFTKKQKRAGSGILNILVMTTGKIGDIVCTTPLLRELKAGQPKSKITVLMYKIGKPILKFNPNVDEIIEIDNYLENLEILKLIKIIKSKRFDWSFNLLLGPLTNVIPFLSKIKDRAAIIADSLTFMDRITISLNNHRIFHKRGTLLIDAYLKLLRFLNIHTNNRKKDLYLNKSIEDRVNKFLDDKGIKPNQPNFIIAVAAGVEFKEWAIDKFAILADRLINKYNARTIFIGTKKDKEKVDAVINLMKKPAINLSGLSTLEELPYLLKRADLFIGADTGPLYIANALDVPVIDILGPIDMYSQPPIYEKCEVVVKNIYCQPCGFTPRAATECREGHLRCIKEVTVEDVENAITKIIKKYNILI